MRAQNQWEARCDSCAHMDDDKKIESTQSWCRKYEARELSFPDPCLSYKSRGSLAEN
jgi:hypothetical protein